MSKLSVMTSPDIVFELWYCKLIQSLNLISYFVSALKSAPQLPSLDLRFQEQFPHKFLSHQYS
jgi:hypothetical protein